MNILQAFEMRSILPRLMPDRQVVEPVTVKRPLGHEPIHQCDESLIVGWLQQVNHFMDDDIFEAFTRLLGQCGVFVARFHGPGWWPPPSFPVSSSMPPLPYGNHMRRGLTSQYFVVKLQIGPV